MNEPCKNIGCNDNDDGRCMTIACDGADEKPTDSILNFIRDFRHCVGTRWRCANGHEWVSAHCACGWYDMPTVCRECGETATTHRGEWEKLESIAADVQRERTKT